MRLSRRFITVCSAFLASAALLRSAAAAEAYLIADAQTGYILEEQEGRKKLQVGSLTKIATASVVLDWAERRSGDLNQVVTIPQEAFAGTLENSYSRTISRPTRWRTMSAHGWSQSRRVNPARGTHRWTHLWRK